jgi:membrane associated rhomboid family serine protease
MLPLRDINPTRRVPIITYALIGINVIVFLWELSFSEAQLQQIFIDLAVVPANIARSGFTPENILDIIRSMFFHGGWAHLLGNMLYLWLFGDNVEDRLGIIMYIVMYFVSGFAAALAQYLIDPTSQIPLVGASGAIAGVLGGYLVLFPGVRVQGIIPLGWFSQLVEWPAYIVLGLWFVMQLFNGVATLGPETGAQGGVAFFAHIGGFIIGAILTWIITMFIPQPPAEDRRQMLYDRAQRYR